MQCRSAAASALCSSGGHKGYAPFDRSLGWLQWKLRPWAAQAFCRVLPRWLHPWVCLARSAPVGAGCGLRAWPVPSHRDERREGEGGLQAEGKSGCSTRSGIIKKNWGFCLFFKAQIQRGGFSPWNFSPEPLWGGGVEGRGSRWLPGTWQEVEPQRETRGQCGVLCGGRCARRAEKGPRRPSRAMCVVCRRGTPENSPGGP